MGFHNQNVMYCSSVKYAAVTAWATNVAKTIGQLVRQTAPTLGNERIWMCYAAGTTNATTEPTWTTSRGDKIATDGTVSWIEVTGLPATNGDSVNTPTWLTGAKSQNVSPGHIIQDAGGTHYFINAGSGANAGTGAEPSWNTGALGATTTDASVTWTYIGTVSSFHSTPWAAPHKTLVRALNTNWMDSGAGVGRQVTYVGHDHAETQTTSMTLPTHGTNNLNNGNSMDIVCVSTAGSMPPVSADLSTAGTVTVTGAVAMQLGAGNYRWVYGLTFTTGNSSGQSIQWTSDNSDRSYENCTFVIPSGAATNSSFQFSGSNGVNYFKNCTFTFSNAAHSFQGIGYAEFDNCTFNGTAITSLYGGTNNSTNARHVFRNCDFSAMTNMSIHNSGNNATGGVVVQMRDCKMPSGWVPGDVNTNGIVNSNDLLVMSRCNVAGTPTAYQYTQNDQAHTLTADATVARANGAQDAGTHISWKVAVKVNVTMNGSDAKPPLIAEWNTVTAANVITTIYGIANTAAMPTNDFCFMNVDYLGSSGTLGVRKSSRIADYIATPASLTADTSDWTAGTVAARQNTHAYSLGDAIKVATNTGRVFFCTAAGTSAGSEPGGFATAVDGGSVTDSGATFRAGWRFKMAVTLTSPQPQLAGNVYAQIRYGLTSTTVYFDPLLSLT